MLVSQFLRYVFTLTIVFSFCGNLIAQSQTFNTINQAIYTARDGLADLMQRNSGYNLGFTSSQLRASSAGPEIFYKNIDLRSLAVLYQSPEQAPQYQSYSIYPMFYGYSILTVAKIARSGYGYQVVGIIDAQMVQDMNSLRASLQNCQITEIFEVAELGVKTYKVYWNNNYYYYTNLNSGYSLYPINPGLLMQQLQQIAYGYQ